jgi:hypothetical protein
LLDELEDALLLGGGVLFGSPVRIRHSEVLKGGPGSCKPWLAGQHLLVHLRGKPLRSPACLVTNVAPVALKQLVERFAPRQLVRRVDEYPVHVEYCTLVCH